MEENKMKGISFILIFEILVLLLGLLIVYRALRMKKRSIVPSLFVSSFEMKKINDEKGFINEIFPNCIIFGVACIAFGVEGILDEFLKFGNRVNSITIIVFLLFWFYFSYMLRKAKVDYSK